MSKKAKTYRNHIDAMLGLTLTDLDDIRKRSRPLKQRQRQLSRWKAHRARVEA
jgi:hypothetical protein